MDSQYVGRAQDWIKWYMYNKNPNMPLEQKLEFQDKCIKGLMEMLARTVEELARIEEGQGRPNIILPSGIEFHEPIGGRK